MSGERRRPETMRTRLRILAIAVRKAQLTQNEPFALDEPNGSMSRPETTDRRSIKPIRPGAAAATA
ncbi:hypothetical protein [Kribbella sp. NPDC050459]|uniref:hypothetical protein n=1 Tax=Kribbella sp. NPDC050459 TaxID=3155785 RepID=UPI0033FBEF3F